ncbi:MAG TPA: polyribonucleotide nucleotidyltransferase, partial [Verrucomicrobiae bacterium]|nr:polyribonucleotide nucleotidyltransferase [Verrucomicrobiae bacterium]
ETGKLAKQAHGSVIVRYGDSVVLVTACRASNPREGIDFLPLTVDYREYTYASGRIPGGFFKREGKPTEKEVLTSRCIDRPTRPLFPAGWRYETQIIALVLSADQENDTDVLAITGASAALALSDIPFQKTVAAVRMGLVDGQYIVNPTFLQRKESKLDLIVVGSKDGLVMVEAGAKEVSEEQVVTALDTAHAAIRQIVTAIDDLAKEAGKTKMKVAKKEIGHDFYREVEEKVLVPLTEAMRIRGKLENYETVDLALKDLVASIPEGEVERKLDAKAIFKELKEKVLREEVLTHSVRLDGRKFDEVRPIWIETGVLPRTHGSAVFTRGQTQVLSIATLGPSGDEQIIDTLSPVDTKRFMHHYNFPPFSVGEVRMMRGAGRREIGHGALAERSLVPVMPTKEEFPYTIRVVSETLESNGSSSMASTCGSTLALMDAGVPIKEMVAGIAMGLVTANGKHTVLTDIQGLEDHYGDMDFKICGSAKGVTGLQMDIKIKGISLQIMREAFMQAREARLFILDAMRKVIDHPREDLSKYAPRIETIKIHPDKIREVIGPGGKMIRAIQSETGTAIELEDDGTVRITGAKPEGRQKAIAMIEGITKEPEVGEVFDGKVTRIMSIGAFVEYLPGKEGLVRVSEISNERVNRIEDVVKVGDPVKVKIAEVDRQGRVNLSIRAVTEENGNSYEERQRAERARYQDREGGGDRGGFRRGPGGGGGGFRPRSGPPRG